MREVVVWTVELRTVSIDPGVLDDEERRRWERLRTDRLRRRFAAAHLARRLILADRLDTDPAGLRFTTGRWGKPELADHSVFHSLSHSAEVAMIALSSSTPVGVDVEAVPPELPATRLARSFFGPHEARSVEAAVDRPTRYIRLWTRKEAAGKVAGTSLDRALRVDAVQVASRPVEVEGLDGVRVRVRIQDIAAPAGFLASVAISGDEPFTVRSSTFRPMPV